MYLYLLNYIHLTLYIICFSSAYYFASFPYAAIPCSIVLGWSLYTLVTIGHDCMHRSFSPYPTLNKVLARIFLDGILMPSYVWQEEHSGHHAEPGNPHDTMLLDGGTFWVELYNLVKAQKTLTLTENLAKLPLLVALLFLPLYCLPIIWFSMITSFMYLSLTPHITHPHLRLQTKEQRCHPKYVAWNMFPKSHLYTFLAGGLNIHGCHHQNPRWTRYQLMQEANEEYMTIDSVEGFLTLLYMR